MNAGTGASPEGDDDGGQGAGGDAAAGDGGAAGADGKATPDEVACDLGSGLCECTSGDTRDCGSDVGSCSFGTKTCLGGFWAECEGGVSSSGLAQDECGPDDDTNCNGTKNEGCSCETGAIRGCGTNVGSCSFGTQTCRAGQWGGCDGANGPATTDQCSYGNDDTCNGLPNEGCACITGESQDCGACGRATCGSGTWEECSSQLSNGASCFQHTFSGWSVPYAPNTYADEPYDPDCPGLWHVSFD